MPLFNWDATHWSAVVSNRFWLYWAVTVPATAMVLILWRVWFKFDHWRMMKGEGPFWEDAKLWWLSRRKSKVVVESEDGRSLSTLSSYVSRQYEGDA